MLGKQFVLKIFEGFSIERWNDLVRPFDLIEMDKSAEKMVLVYIIGKFEEQRGKKVDWDWLIHASFFELLCKIALCDIKAPVKRMIRTQYPDEYRRLNDWVFDSYKDLMSDDDLRARFRLYLDQTSNVPQSAQSATPTAAVQNGVASAKFAHGAQATPTTARTLEMDIFRAAHKYSTMREFEMIAPVNEAVRLTEIEKELNEDIGEYLHLQGLQKLVTKQKAYDFLLVIEKLRFQTRWNQTPRVPKTSVLGHSFFVAVLTLLLGRESEKTSGVKMCASRVYNNFFSALFHDLPEAVTRDIISPVKYSTSALPSIVKDIEDNVVQQQLLPLMEDFYAKELLYFTNNEFENRIRFADVDIRHVSFEDLNAKFNTAQYSPVDGKLVRVSDHIAAFLEADSSINYGITSKHLRDGRENVLNLYTTEKAVNGFDVASFFREFA